jgi:hypothetical protein
MSHRHPRHSDLKNSPNPSHGTSSSSSSSSSNHQVNQPHNHHQRLTQNRRKLSFLRSIIICGIVSITIVTLGISFLVISDSYYGLLDSEEETSLFSGTSGIASSSTSSSSSTGSDATILQQQRQQQLHLGSYPNYQEIRKQAIEEASKLTQHYVHMEEKMQRILEREKEEYRKKIAKEQQAKKEKEDELKREYMESKYYMYYEDSNDSESTVIGMSYSQDPRIYKRFVGSLRKTGFGGKIILGIEDVVSEDIKEYLRHHNVTLKKLEPVECSFVNAKKRQKCYKPYPHIKREWAHFPLARDWLSGCASCSGPVVFASVDRTFFQLNPFGSGMPVVKRLHLYEQHPSVHVAKTSAGVLLKACVDIDLEAEMQAEYPDIEPRGLLSAATALGTRDDIIDYLGLVYSSIREWMQKTECHFQHSSSDTGMAIVNFLRVKERLPYRTRLMVHRTGIVNNVDFEGQNALEAHVHLWTFRGLTKEEANLVPYEGGKGKGWIDTDYMVTDEDGFFIDVFFEKSAIVYGYDSFGLPFMNWLDRQLNITSPEENSKVVLGSDKTSLLVPENVTLDIANIKKRQVKGATQQQKDDEGYYIDKSIQENLADNSTLVERKKEVKVGDTTPILDDKDASHQDTMYYPGEPKNVTTKVDTEQKVVPVDESHEKGSEKKVEETNIEDGEENGDENGVNNPVERVPVDTKFEVPIDE